jgi:calcineurin-like phosphoesterase
LGRSGRAIVGTPAGTDPRRKLEFVVVNGENAAGGFGITGRSTRT